MFDDNGGLMTLLTILALGVMLVALYSILLDWLDRRALSQHGRETRNQADGRAEARSAGSAPLYGLPSVQQRSYKAWLEEWGPLVSYSPEPASLASYGDRSLFAAGAPEGLLVRPHDDGYDDDQHAEGGE